MNKIGTLSIIFSSVLVGCGGEDSSNNSGEESSSVVSTMTMTVKASNYFTGDSIEGASIVIVEGSDEQITSYSGITDSNGEVSLDVNSDVTRFIVSGDAQSFGEYSKVCDNVHTNERRTKRSMGRDDMEERLKGMKVEFVERPKG